MNRTFCKSFILLTLNSGPNFSVTQQVVSFVPLINSQNFQQKKFVHKVQIDKFKLFDQMNWFLPDMQLYFKQSYLIFGLIFRGCGGASEGAGDGKWRVWM